MSYVFGKKKELSVEEKNKYELLDKERDKTQAEFEAEPEGTKEKGSLLLKYIHLTEEMHKIKSSPGDSLGVTYLKTMYKTGLRMKKWKE